MLRYFRLFSPVERASRGFPFFNDIAPRNVLSLGLVRPFIQQ